MQSYSIALLIIAALFACENTGPAEVSSSPNRHYSLAMTTNLPRFSLPWSMFDVPTLGVVSRIAAKNARKSIYKYYAIYSTTLMKHLCSETEVKIVAGEFTADSHATFVNLEVEQRQLQYKEHLGEILEQWSRVLSGQPLSEVVHELLNNQKIAIVAEVEEFIYKLQAVSIRRRQAQDNILCNKVCTNKPKILNLTSIKVPSDLEQALENGCNFVPHDTLSSKELQSLIENDLINAAINFYRDKNQIYPLVNKALGLKTVLEQLISQSSSNTSHIEYYNTMFDSYFDLKGEFYKSQLKSHFIEQPSIQKLVPPGTILAEADKGLGPCLLPVEWFIDQYKVQSLKGNHILTKMSNDQCINFLKKSIDAFRSGLGPEA